ncbi:MAG: nucleotidyltransferase family protein [candidate division KSB1 bacterium]|nr:nucleotidyltransferase family protein [candidate division KSB1 bacterium]
MRAILLCAGFATRMYPLTRDFPKPLLPVAGRPVLDYLLDQLLNLPGLLEIALVTNARFYGHFEAWLGEREPRLRQAGMDMRLFNDGATANDNRLGAVGDLAFVLERLSDVQPTLVAAGDNIFRFSLQSAWERFRREKQNVILALPEDDPAKLRKTAVLELAENDRVLKLHEKPEQPTSHWMAPALYLLQPEALRLVPHYLQQSDAGDAPGYFIAYLVKKQPVYAMRVFGSRLDIGSPESYRHANVLLRSQPVIVESGE